jgi:hypothetical protein
MSPDAGMVHVYQCVNSKCREHHREVEGVAPAEHRAWTGSFAACAECGHTLRWLRKTERRAAECETCKGSGTVPERHEPWAVEWLACPDCGGTGKVPEGLTT